MCNRCWNFSCCKGLHQTVNDQKVNGGKVEPSITAEKGSGFNEKRKTTDVWKKYVYFQQQTCTFSLEKANIYEFGKIMAYRYSSE